MRTTKSLVGTSIDDPEVIHSRLDLYKVKNR